MSSQALLTDEKARANAYLVKEVLEATPQKLLLKIFDFAILHCKKGDVYRTNNALSELINSLNFEDEKARELSIQLLRLYQFSQEEMRKQNIEVVLKILTTLRETWANVFTMEQLQNV
ncbi:MAG: flagellar protein FliS [Ignavibacteria bacterium]|jgi:flagellin-specific chaperone FliS